MTNQQHEDLTVILAEHAPSLPDSERAKTLEQLETFIGENFGTSDSRSEGWITLPSRYPEPGERVLVFVPRWGLLTIGWVSKNDATRWELITLPGKSTDQVSHWHPLPASPAPPSRD